MTKKKSLANNIWTVFFSILSVLYMYPIVMVILNSLKVETAISTSTAFELPTAETFAGLDNYINAINSQGFLSSLFYSLFITVSSVALILLCCSMCAWSPEIWAGAAWLICGPWAGFAGSRPVQRASSSPG